MPYHSKYWASCDTCGGTSQVAPDADDLDLHLEASGWGYHSDDAGQRLTCPTCAEKLTDRPSCVTCGTQVAVGSSWIETDGQVICGACS